MQVYFPSLRQVPGKATILKNIRAYRRIAKAIINANPGGFGTDEAEKIAYGIIFIVIILAVGGFIIADVLGVLGQAMPTVSQSNPLYNATISVVHGLMNVGTLFSSTIGLISILILIVVVSTIIAVLRSGFGRGGTGT